MPNIEELIRRAIEEGKFKDLPGKGKPLNLEDNPHEDLDWRLAYHVLKSSGFTLPWIETRQDLLNQMDEQRQALRRSWAWQQGAAQRTSSKLSPASEQVKAEWRLAQDNFRKQMEKLDRRIRDFNLEVPSERFQLPRLHIDEEIAAITQEELG